MQRSSTTEEIILKLRKIEISVNQGKSIRLSCREAGISDHMYYKWRREYGGLNIDQERELKKLKEENLRLKKAVADLTLNKLILNKSLAIGGEAKPKILSPQRKIQVAVEVMQKLGVSERKTCDVLRLNRAVKRYKLRKSNDEQKLKEAIVRLVSKYGRYSYFTFEKHNNIFPLSFASGFASLSL